MPAPGSKADMIFCGCPLNVCKADTGSQVSARYFTDRLFPLSPAIALHLSGTRYPSVSRGTSATECYLTTHSAGVRKHVSQNAYGDCRCGDVVRRSQPSVCPAAAKAEYHPHPLR